MAPEFCFVGLAVMKQAARQDDALTRQVVQSTAENKKPG
jgi:hypothetical protein